MFQRSIWMRPALQTSEAVLLPALNRLPMTEPFNARLKPAQDAFRPVQSMDGRESLALSTYVRPQGSMAGRSVLRAAGMTGEPFSGRGKPRYYAGKAAKTIKLSYGYGARLPAKMPPQSGGYR